MTKFIEASIGFYEQMSKKSDNDDIMSGPTSDSIFGMNGGLDFKQYKEYVKNNIAKSAEESSAGSMINMIMQNKDLLISNPVGALTKGVMSSLIPKVLKSSMEELDRSVKEVIPVVLERIGEIGENDNSLFGSLGRTFGKIFGIKTERKEKFDTSKIDKGPVPYNGIANHTIVEIIPKYLRESNTYLREIAEAVTGKSNDEMEGKFTGFDWETGTFKNINEMRDNLYSQISDEVVSTIERSDFGKKLTENAGLLNNEKDKDSYEKALQQFYTAMEMHKGALNFNNEDHLKELMDAVSAPDNIKNLIKASIQDMKESESTLWGSAYNAKRDATRKKNTIMTGFEEEASKNGLYQIDNGKSYDQYIRQRMKDNKSLVATVGSQDASINTDAKGSGTNITSTPGLLQGILNTLNRGIYVQIKDKLEGSTTTSTSTTQTAEESATLDKATQKAIARHKRKESKKHKGPEDGSYDDFKSQLEAQRGAEIEDTDVGEEIEEGGTISHSAAVAGKITAFSKVLNGIMNGNADQAWDAFIGGLQDKFKQAGDFLGEHFFNPMKEKLFGKKDENGYLDDGLFAGVNNRMKESFYSFRRMITGKGYIDAEGNTVADANDEEMGNTVVGKLKNMLGDLKDGISLKLFGSKEEIKDEDGNAVGKDEGIVGKAKDKLIGATSSFYKGVTGWKHALFGKDSDEDEDGEEAGKKTLEDFKKKASEVLPSAITGGIAGGAFGLASGGLLGWAIGGPIGGALLGFGTGILSKSEKFQKFLFGETDDDGNEVSKGIISRKLQDFVKENKKFIIGGAALGAIKGTFTGGGLLGTLVGGPVAGALLGIGSSMLIKSDMFQKFLYGDAERGQLGLINTVKGMFGKFGKSNGIASGGKVAGMAGIGAGIGAITIGALTNSGILGLALGPAGPIGGAILGLGTAMIAQKDNFKEWLFGKTDEETGEHREGIIGQFKNMLTVSVFKPLGNNLQTIGEDFKTFLKYDILERFNLVIEPIGNAIFGTFAKIGGSLKDTASKFGAYIKNDFLGDVVEGAKKIFEPLTGAVNTIGTGLYKVGKTIMGAPLAMLSAITSPIALGIANVAKTATKAVFGAVDLALLKPMKYLVLKPLGLVTKTAATVIAKPFELLGNVAGAINDKVTNFTHHVKTFFAQIGSDFRQAVVYPFKKFGEEVKEFGGRIVETAKIIISPVTDFVTSALDEVKNGIKNSIKRFFHFLNPITWIKGIGKGAKKLLGLGGGDEEEKDTSKMGYLRRVWHETGKKGYKVDHSGEMTYDDDGNLIGTKMSRAQRIRASKLNKETDRIKNKEDAKERKRQNYNEKLIAKWTNNQKYEDTEENRQLAIAMARRKGKQDIGFKGKATVKTVQEKLVEQQVEATDNVVDETRKGNSILSSIQETLHTMFFGSRERKRELAKRASFLSGHDGKVSEEKHEKNAKVMEEHGKILAENVKEGGSKKVRKEASSIHKDMFSDNFNTHGFLGGLKENFSMMKNQLKGSIKGLTKTDDAENNVDAHASGVSNAKPGPAIVGEKGPEAMYRKGAKKGKFVGLNGPEVINLKGGETIIPNNKIDMFADGTSDSNEPFKSKISNKNLIQESNVMKLSVSERILREIILFKKNVASKLGDNPFIGFGGSFDSDKKSSKKDASIQEEESKENTETNIPEEPEEQEDTVSTENLQQIGAGLRRAGRSLINHIPGIGIARGVVRAGKNATSAVKTGVGAVGELGALAKKKVTDAKIAAGKAAQALVSKKSGAAMHAARLEEKEKKAAEERQNVLLTSVDTIKHTLKEHAFSWLGMFGKKGLITIGLFGAFMLLKKFLGSGMLEKLKEILGTAFDNIVVDVGSIAIKGLAKGLKAIGKTFKVVGKGIKAAVKGVTKAVKSVGKGINFIKSKVTGIWKKIFGDKADDAAKEVSEEATKKAGKKAGKNAGKKVGKEGTDVTIKEGEEKLTKEAGDATVKSADDIGETVVKDNIDDVAEGAAKNQKKPNALKRAWNKLTGKNSKKAGETLTKEAGDATIKSADDIGESLVKGSWDANGKYISKEASDKAIEKSVKRHEKKLAKQAAKKAAVGGIDDAAATVAKTQIDDAVTTVAKNKGLLDNVLGMIDNFVNSFLSKVSKKAGKKVGPSIVSGLIQGIKKHLPKHFPKIAPKIGAILTATAGLASTVIGLAAKEATWVTLGAISGATGAKRLFETDEIDGTMVIISTALGAFNGTTVGGICDIINELLTAVAGLDIYHELAVQVYNYLAGEEKADLLAASQKAFKEKYEEDENASLQTQYNTMIEAGLLDPGVSFEDYKAGAQEGTYAASIKDFSDYNDEQHQTLGSKAGKLAGKAFKGTKNFFMGKETVTYKDNNGNTYSKKDDGTYAVTNAEGKEIGFVDKSALPQDAVKDVQKTDGLVGKVKNVGATIGNAVGNVGKTFSNVGNGLKDIVSKNIDYVTGKSDSIEYGKSEDGTNGPMNALAKMNQFALAYPRGVIAVGKGIAKFIGNAAKAIKNVFTTVVPPATDYLIGKSDSIDLGCPEDNPGKPIIGAVEKMMQFGLAYPRGVIAVGKGIGKFIGKGVKFAKKFIPDILSQSKDYLLGNSDDIKLGDKDEMSAPMSLISKLAKYALTMPRGYIMLGKGIAKFIGKGAKFAKKFIPDVLSQSKDYLLGNSDDIKLGDGDKMNAPMDVISTIAKYALTLPRGLVWVAKGIGKFIGKGIRNVKDFGSNMLDGAKKYISGESDSISANVSKDNPLQGVVGVVSTVLEYALYPIRIVNQIIAPVKELISDAKDAAGDAIDGIKERLSDAGDAIGGAWNFLTGGGEGQGRRRKPQLIGGSGDGNSEPSSLNGVPYYSQNDSRWANKKFVKSDGTDDGATMSTTGCGPAAMSMVISDMTNKKTNPVDLAKFAQSTGSRDDSGTNQAFIADSAAAYGIGSKQAYNPDGNYITSQLSNGNPVVLLGQSGGSGASPYTDSGHYIVATGLDSDGKVKYNDPRGKSFSGKIDANQLANSTTSMWSFNRGGKGKEPKGSIMNMIRRRGGKGGNNFTAQDVITVAANEIGYVEKASNSNLDSKTGNPGTNNYTKYERDVFGSSGSYWCASFVSWCFYTAANKNKAKAKKVLGELSRACETIRQKFLSNKRFDKNPQPGDCIFFSGTRHSGANHIGIVESVSNGKVNTIEGNTSMGKGVVDNGGGVARKSYDVNYNRILGYGHPNYDGSSSFAGVSSSTDATTSSSSGGVLDKIGDISSKFATFGSTLFNAVLSGDTNVDWKAAFAENSSSDSSSSDSSSSDSGDVSANIQGGDVAKNVWKFFTDAGYSPATTAGIMGNLAQESGLNPKSIQGNGAGPAAGIAQWESYNAWKAGKSREEQSRFGNLAEYAKKKNTDWTDLGTQLEFMNKELTTNDFALRVSGKLAPSNLTKAGAKAGTSFEEWKKMDDVDESTRLFEGAFERAGKPMMDNRLKAAKSYYKKFSKGGSGDGVKVSNKKYFTLEPETTKIAKTEQLTTNISDSSIIKKANSINKQTTSTDVSTLANMMGEIISLLGSISKNSNNLSLLKDIKNIAPINIEHNTTNNNVSAHKASKTKTSTSTTMSANEMTARKIAFGS